MSISAGITYFIAICLVIAHDSVSPLYAQDNDNLHPTFQHLTVEDGLPSNNIYCLYKDRKGFMWFGTDDGAVRYDGIDFLVFKHSNKEPNSLVNNIVESIVEDAEGNIWFGTYNGLSCYHQKENRFENFRNEGDDCSLSHNGVGDIVVDKNGTIWIGTYDGLNEFIPSSREFKVHRFEELIEMNYVCHIAYDGDTKIWLNGKKALYAFDVDSKTFFSYSHEAEHEYFGGRLITDLVLEGNNTLWVCTWGAGLRRFDITAGRYVATYKIDDKSPPSGNTNIVNALAFQPQSSGDTIIWIAAVGEGLGELNRSTGQLHFHTHDASNALSIATNYISHVYFDHNQILWIGTSEGVERIDWQSQRIKRVRIEDPDSVIVDAFNHAMGFPYRNEVWLSGEFQEGVFRYDEMTGNLTHILLDKHRNPGEIYTMLTDSQKRFWICAAHGIFLYDPFVEKFIRKGAPENVRTVQNFTSMEEYGPGQFVLGVSGIGAVLYDEPDNRFDSLRVLFDTADGLSTRVYDVAYDEFDNVWIATRQGAFVVHMGDRSVRLFSTGSTQHDRISNDIVITLGAEWSHGMWIGTMDGLYFYDQAMDSLLSYHSSDGLAHDIVYDIYHDTFGNIWFATRNGLSRYDRASDQFFTYRMSDGLLRNSIYSSIMGTDEGKVYIGGREGYNWFYSSDLEPNPVLPPVVITSFRIKGIPFPWETLLGADSTLHFNHNQNDFSFEFAALSYSNPRKNTYAHRLIGYDDAWTYSGTVRNATYTNLESGSYVFEVRGTNNDGVWSDAIARIRMRIAPPFWETRWFLGFCVLFGITTFFGVIRIRTAGLRRQKQVLEHTVKERTAEFLQQKELAEQHRMRAEQSEKFQEQFLANMSHEIRTPMNAVMGMTNLLIAKSPAPHQTQYLEGIRNSSETLLHIIDDILDISKIEAGKIEIESIDFYLRPIAEQVFQILKFKADEKHIQLSLEFDESIPGVLIGDPVRINQVLMNLGGNAIKFTNHGLVQLQIGYSEDVNPDPDIRDSVTHRVRFAVVDTGIGISPEKQEMIFESFTQAHASDTRNYGGTGLGLSISKQLVQYMGGSLRVESEIGKGSTFSFDLSLPAGSAEKAKQRMDDGMSLDGSTLDGLRILLADDDEYNRIVATDTLQSKANVIVHNATNGVEVLQKLNEADYDVILMDIQMPGMDGYETARHIRDLGSDFRNHGIPILALTASVLRSDLANLDASGMNGYVPKPFRVAQLITAIANVTGREIRHSVSRENRVSDVSGTRTTDLSSLEAFCENDRSRMEKYIRLFLLSASEFMEAIEVTLAHDNRNEIANQVHRFKTKMMMMGMHEAVDIVVRLEQMCNEKVPIPKLMSEIARLQFLMRKAVEELKPEIGLI